ncbi:enoyl-CoA hydratase-related protein [Mycobacterium intracellulare]|uniref:enoyl-CoA hydratase-related protein n=1 Tax=Mycobacterium intracellulare TaxID=1767 RepID=UPI000446B827|nr:enoyl-CoA hydratase-related protein [Mycobacterium intracellulare]APD84376.1 carnitinyl-CoA dehydratase [Mycobacterium intracellulare subsp. chimaera]ARV84210.1 carnitinyl-CoA dehydratase [Mycobacterium intracellulare subsp. chimaera]ASL11527.1 short chain enoyl-CoA hydratase [Mycobacterium intracellulare subsp. chimaera]ASL23477.1 short chain enoyl-CoA hydratase [Mycobacterium intracellulare subsp. chimaera]ETZ27170.1 enoyl-CoA hydratase/isomerase family protein [Mycobacterium intracellula
MPVHYELAPRPGAEHVALITLDRPEAKNACDLEHFHQLAQAWKRFSSDDAAWVAIFTGVERSFMSGADLKTYVPEITALSKKIQAGEATTVDGYSLSDGTDAVLRGSKIDKPIIAAINGPCVAGGMEMLGGIDIRIASEHATFGVLEPARGLFAGGGTTVRLPRQVPFAHAMEFLLCADRIDAQKALDMGLLNAVVAEDALLDKAFEYASRITKNAPLAVRATKRSVIEGLKLNMREAYRNEAAISKEIFSTEDAKEGPRAFAEKRAPRWSGR